jgi:phytoene dehydrogenase-like protein
VRYDAAIIGAGTNGLAAAATLARAGLSVAVFERAERAGGRCATREFHPGFRASPFCDEIAPIPAAIFRALDLARYGAIFMPSAKLDAHLGGERFGAEIRKRIAEHCAYALEAAKQPKKRDWLGRPADPALWPKDSWSARSLSDVLEEALPDEKCRALALATALDGRAADPYRGASAFHLLAPHAGSGMTMGGLETFANALHASAQAAGVEFSLGLEVSDVRFAKRGVTGIRLADGTEVEARAVISTLDLKRTFLALFAWKELPEAVARRTSAFRHAPATARLLLALDAPPALPEGPVHVPSCSVEQAYAAWRTGTMPSSLPMTLRSVSAADPRLAPAGKAVLTATLGAIPYQLFDGAWTNEKRVALRARALAHIESVLPGLSARVLAAELIVPPDIEEALGVTQGDLDGGEIAPDQMFSQRAFAQCEAGRTPIGGLYLGGRSAPAGPFGSCVAGVVAAHAVMSDLAGGHLQ